jgi:outer membrane protein assembly factor BamB
MGVVDGRELVFFAAGNGIVYAFEPLARSSRREEAQTSSGGKDQSLLTSAATNPETPAKLKKIWRFDFDPAAPKEEVHHFNTNRREGPSNMYGMPVFHEGRIYVAGGGDWFWGKNEAWLKCFDARGAGDITTNALRWSYPLGRHTMCTPAVHDGLVYATDSMRTLHCVDATTGQAVWTHELKGEIWASALVADGKVFVGTRRGDFWVFADSREKKMLSTVELGAPISATTTAANGALFVVTMTHLYAIAPTGER